MFGANGDLAKRKLLPGLLHLDQAGLLPPSQVIGVSLEDMGTAEFREGAREACREHARHDFTEVQWDNFASQLHYVPNSAAEAELVGEVEKAMSELGEDAELMHYLSIPPGAARDVIALLGRLELNRESKVIMEKPFGTDLASAVELNTAVHAVFNEEQVFRIDHFLGKEAAQNILALRFANGLFEPIWNRNHIEHVQIDVPETLMVGSRAAFYERTGAYRDMVVTHLMQILAFVAMEPPTSLAPGPITEEKNKVFRSLAPINPAEVVRGQYESYTSEPGVAHDSETETFIALKCRVDNWRWSNVPFYLRTGKKMPESQRIISIAYRQPPQSMFPRNSRVGEFGPDHLTFDLDESSRVSLSFYGKRPGMGMTLDKASMQFSLEDTGRAGDTLEAYERLIRDAMAGDHTLFTTADGIERLWAISQPLLDAPPATHHYPDGSWGPSGINKLIAPHEWRLPFARKWRETRPASVAPAND